MSLKDILKRNLSSEMFTSVCDALGDDFDYDMVPRTRLNKVIAQRNELRGQVASMGKPNTKGAAAEEDDDDDDDDEGDVGGGTMTLKDFKKLLKDSEKKHAKEIADLKKQNVALDKLRAKNAIDPDTVLKSGLLDLDKLELGEDGTLKGIDEAIEGLIKDKSYFFETTDGDDGHDRGTGKRGGGDDGKDSELDSKLAQIFGPEPSNDNA